MECQLSIRRYPRRHSLLFLFPFPLPPFLVGSLINNIFIAITLAIDFRFPDIQAKVVPTMKDYLLALRSKDDTPSPLLMTSRTSEEDVLDSFKAEIVAKQAGRNSLFLKK
jgi:hypothetical protein